MSGNQLLLSLFEKLFCYVCYLYEYIFSQMNPIDEVEAATASITQQSNEEETENIVNSVTLEHCAEEILSGIKKEVEVQYLVPMMVSNNESTHPNQQTQELHYPVKESGNLIN